MNSPNDIVEDEWNWNSNDLSMLNEQPLGEGRVRRQGVEGNFLRLAQLLSFAEILLQELDDLLFPCQLFGDRWCARTQLILYLSKGLQKNQEKVHFFYCICINKFLEKFPERDLLFWAFIPLPCPIHSKHLCFHSSVTQYLNIDWQENQSKLVGQPYGI